MSMRVVPDARQKVSEASSKITMTRDSDSMFEQGTKITPNASVSK